jgi:putative endonuclease
MPINLSNHWVVYILRCADDTLYTGATNNIHKRLAAHNAGKGAKYTKGRLPAKLHDVFVCDSKSAALKLEYKIKQLSRKDKLEFRNEVAVPPVANPT